MIRAEIHTVTCDPNGWRQQTTHALTVDIGHWSTEVLEDLAKRVLVMRAVDEAVEAQDDDQ